MVKYISNYHNHSKYCGHGEGVPVDYIKVAINNGIKNIGFTEHGPLPKSKFAFTIINHENEYIQDVLECKEKFKDKINVYLGLEMDYYPEFNDYYEYLLTKYDYLTLSIHFLEYGENFSRSGTWSGFLEHDKIDNYKEKVIKGVNTGFFKYVNHPELFVKIWDDYTINASIEIINECIKTNTPLELNGNQFKTKYDLYYNNVRDEFWKLVGNMNCPVVINTDAHKPKDVYKENLEEMFEYAKNHNLNVISELKIK